MLPPFDIFKFDIFKCEALDSVIWVCGANHLDVAKAKVESLMRDSPSDFLIVNHSTGKTFRMKPDGYLAERQNSKLC